MKLIAAPVSPYSRKVRIVLAEKRIDYEMVVDNPGDPATRVPEFNPLGKIPVLVLDDEITLFDSRVIVEYLDNASPVGRLIPEDTRQRIQVRRWEALADGCTDAAVAVVMEKRRPADKQSAEWLARQQGKIDRALHAMSCRAPLALCASTVCLSTVWRSAGFRIGWVPALPGATS